MNLDFVRQVFVSRLCWNSWFNFRSSLTSSGSGSSSDSMTTTSAKIKLGSAKSRWKQMKKGSMRKLSNLTNRLNMNNSSKSSKPGNGNVPKVEDVVNTAPDGRLGNVLPRIQASKSMQNLEQVCTTLRPKWIKMLCEIFLTSQEDKHIVVCCRKLNNREWWIQG